jgi:hypothetical protein
MADQCLYTVTMEEEQIVSVGNAEDDYNTGLSKVLHHP